MIALVTTPRKFVHFSVATEPRMLFGLAHLVDDTWEGGHYSHQLLHASRDLKAYLVIDNGVTEVGKPLSLSELYRIASKVQANEIVLPDEYQNAEGTREHVQQALIQLRRAPEVTPFECMAVVHEAPDGLARTLEEWSKHTIIKVLGIPKHQTVSGHWKEGRLSLLRAIENLGYAARFVVHMLGVWQDMREVQTIAREFPWVRSIDTSWPVMAGIAGIDIEEQPTKKVPYSPNPAGWLGRGKVDLILHNTEIYQRWAEGR